MCRWQTGGCGPRLGRRFDCAYLADVAVQPKRQGRGLGSDILRILSELAHGHKKILLCTTRRRTFFRKIAFRHVSTVIGIWKDPGRAIAIGLIN
ncbi:GNAT family N-acetyltransferase [Streptomyces sp. NPDC057375]|uniref:GNAT family N-acetyltransferase n=1 Tax=Streptomyces sp. NPDC057375 TaxID=3346109 RepID=UPI00362DF6FB